MNPLFSEVYGIEQIDDLAAQLNKLMPVGCIIVVDGQMGAGKTTLIKAIMKQKKVLGQVQSPTFAIVNEYLCQNNETVYHFDFYRLKTPTEALDFGVEEYFDSGNSCFIEWAEKIGDLLPPKHLLVTIEMNGTERRCSVYQKPSM